MTPNRKPLRFTLRQENFGGQDPYCYADQMTRD